MLFLLHGFVILIQINCEDVFNGCISDLKAVLTWLNLRSKIIVLMMTVIMIIIIIIQWKLTNPLFLSSIIKGCDSDMLQLVWLVYWILRWPKAQLNSCQSCGQVVRLYCHISLLFQRSAGLQSSGLVATLSWPLWPRHLCGHRVDTSVQPFCFWWWSAFSLRSPGEYIYHHCNQIRERTISNIVVPAMFYFSSAGDTVWNDEQIIMKLSWGWGGHPCLV